MSADNPYAAPQAELVDIQAEPSEIGLASRSSRFTAAFVDSIIGLAFGIPVMYLTGTWKDISAGRNPPTGVLLLSSALGFVAFVLIHGYFLKANGQTLGKKLAGIRIADLDGGVPDLGKVLLRRYLPISVVSQIPMVGPLLTLVDALFIFRTDRRCIHDLIAVTRVVQASQRGKA